MFNISQEEVEMGQVQYVMHGKEMEKNRYVWALYVHVGFFFCVLLV